MNVQEVIELYTKTRQPLISTKGKAAPSPARLEAQCDLSQQPLQSHQPVRHVESPQIGIMPANNLAGLIKRSNPARILPPQPIETISFSAFKKQIDKPASKPEPSPVRRQLTVRIEMTQFQKLEELALSTDKSFQEIQASALEEYLPPSKSS
ncbi:MAG: hypothetical protein HON65_12975 [Rhodospirillales bacterium]|jgi:hypothetical protein|nr:hypothetical protein [Rhodospirillales bacterium]